MSVWILEYDFVSGYIPLLFSIVNIRERDTSIQLNFNKIHFCFSKK